MKLFSTSTLGLMLISAASTVYAAEPESQHNLQQTPFYFGLDVASLRVKDSSRDIKDALTEEIGSTPTVKQDKNAGAGRIFAGYTFNQNLSVELAYLKTSTTKTDISDSAAGYTASLKTDVKGAEIAGLFSPSQLPNFFVKAGAVYSEIDGRIRVVGSTVASANPDEKGWGYVVGFGYKYPVNEVLDIKATYAHYGRVAGESDLYLNLLSLGFQYHY